MTLIEFLRARLDEDEQLALACPYRSWSADGPPGGTVMLCGDAGPSEPVPVSYASSDGRLVEMRREPGRFVSHLAESVLIHDPDEATLRNAAHHDPVRVLAEVDVKRRIVEVVMEQWRPGDILNGSQGADDIDHQPPWLLRVLALPYTDHPDYDESWRPA